MMQNEEKQKPAVNDDQAVLFDPGEPKVVPPVVIPPEPPKPEIPDLTAPLPFDKLTGAIFDDTRIYRYVLWRVLKEKGDTILWIGLNPSTADEDTDDPTVKRMVDYSKRWGYANVIVANLFAFRATDPKVMKKALDPIGPENWNWLKRLYGQSQMCVVAWGNGGAHKWTGRRTLKMLLALGPIYCMRMTKMGHPGHPLYLPKILKPQLIGEKALAAMFEDE